MNFFYKTINSPIAQYIGARYITYGIQFLNSILIAKYLGVYYFGIYSFLQLIKQYLLYTGMAPSYSLSTILSTRKNEKHYANLLWKNSLLLSGILIGVAIVAGVTTINFFPDLFIKYELKDYFLFIILIFGFNSLNHLFVNLYRTYGLLKKINFFELIVPLFQLMVLFIATEKELLYYLLIGTIVGNCVSLIWFLYNPPLKFGLNFTKKIFKTLFLRGFHLLLFNVSFALILISSRTLVSIFYSPEELGYYTFAVNLSNAVFMIVGAFGFVMYPKILNKLYSRNNSETIILLKQVKSIYISGCFLLTYAGFFSIFFLEYFLPQYIQALAAFKILLITQLILNNNFGYSILLVAKGKEKIMTGNALWGMTIIIIISLAFVYANLPFTMISVAVSAGFIFYCLKITRRGLEEIGQKADMKDVLFETFPYYYLIPLLILIVSVVLEENFITPLLSLMIFGVLNKNRVLGVGLKIKELIMNKKSLEF